MRFLAWCSFAFFLTLISCDGDEDQVQELSRLSDTITIKKEIPGNIAFSDAVDRLGNFNITIPIDALPAGNNLIPKLTLNYSSANSGEYSVGRGWSLGGLWSVRRCSASKAIDGFWHSPNLGMNDRFCLNSDRLIVIKGTYGENGSEYRTAIDSHMKIVYTKAFPLDAGRFEVKNRAGETMTFGSDSASRDESPDGNNAYSWHVDRIVDRNGNHISYAYDKGQGGRALIKSVSYGGNISNSVAHYRTLVLNYSVTPKKAYAAYGRLFYDGRTLTSVDMLSDEKLIWSYALNYSTDRIQPVLKSLRKCFADGACYREVSFGYEPTGPQISEAPVLFAPSFGNQSPNYFSGQNAYRTAVDLDRDGFDDLLAINASGIFVGKGSKDGFGELAKVGTDPVLGRINIKIDTVEVADVNRDTYPDIVILQTTGANPGTWVGLGGPTGFSTFSSWISFPTSFWKAQVHLRTLADIDVDGYMDLVGYNDKGIFVYKNLGDRFQPTDSPVLGEFGALQKWSFVDHPRYIFDVNGDGFPDIVGFHQTEVKVALGNGVGFEGPRVWSSEFGRDRYSPESPRYLADVNRDGLPDIVGFALDGVRVGLNNGREFSASELWFSDLGYNQGWTTKTQVRVVYDVNADGIADFIGITPTKAKVYFGRDRALTATEQAEAVEIPLSLLKTWNRQLDPSFFVQLPGSQRPAFAVLMSGGIWALKSDAGYGRLNSAKDSLGNETGILFSGFADPNVYTQDTNFSYPKEKVHAGLSLVKHVVRKSPGQGNRTITYSYKNGAYNREGFGFVGFSEITESDSATGQLVKKTFNQSIRGSLLDGRPAAEVTYVLKDGAYKQLTNSVTQWSVRKNYGMTLPAQILQTSNIVNQYSLAGQFISRTATTQDFDQLGNLIDQEITSSYQGSEVKKVIYNRYDQENEEKWIIGRLTQSIVTHKRTGQPDIDRTTEFHYDSSGNLDWQTQEPQTPFEIKKTFSRFKNKFGLIDTTITTWPAEHSKGLGFSSTTETINFDGRGFPSTSMNVLNHVTTHTFNPVFGIETGKMDANNIGASSQLDSHGEVEHSVSFDGVKTSFIRSFCDSSCPNTAIYYIKTSAPGRGESIAYFDSKQRPVRESAKAWNGKTINVDRSYNILGQLTSESGPYYVGDPVFSTTYFYDELQRPWKTVRPDKNEITISYSEFKETLKNPDGHTTTRETNPQGEVIAVTDHLKNRTTYEYRADGKLKAIIDWKGNSTTYEYDILGRQTMSRTPDSGTTETKYNALGLPYEIIDAKNDSVSMTYDQMGRIKSKQYSAGPSESWKYDEKVIGLVDETSKADFKEVYNYDELGRTRSVTTEVKGHSYSVSKGFDKLGRVETLTYPTGLAVRYAYADDGTMTAITSIDKTKTYWALNASDAAGRATSETHGGQVFQTWNWNQKTGYLDDVVSQNSAGTIVQSNHYEYKASGLLKSDEDRVTRITEGYQHDELGRLYEVTRGPKRVGLTFNELGDIKTKSDVGSYVYGVSCPGASAPGPHAPAMINGNSRCYNAKGQMISGDGKTINYTFSGQPARVAQSGFTGDFLYDTNNQKVYQKTQSNSRVTERYFVAGLFEESVENGTVSQKVHIGSSVVIATKNSVEDRQYLIKNRLGSVALVVGSSGNVVERLYYSPWGERWDFNGNSTKAVTASSNQLGFTNHEHLDDIGMIHAGGRLYDPRLAFFASPDPITQDIYLPQVFNRYSYAFNSPLRFIDPSGLANFNIGAAFEGLGRIVSDPLRWMDRGGVRLNKWLNRSNNQRMLASLAISVAGGYLAGPVLGLQGTNYMLFSAATGATASYVASNGDTRSTAIGAVQGFAFAGIGEFFDVTYKGDFSRELRVLAHATAGGAISRAQGSNFESGFVSSAVRTAIFAYGMADSAFGAGETMQGFERSAYNAVIAGLIEGSLSELTGGSFENGALTGAFAQLFNEELHKLREIIEPYLRFDGSGLTWIDMDGAIKSWPAVSGAEGFQSKEHTFLKNKGPIPEGVWLVEQNQYQNFWDYSAMDILGSPFMLGKWPGSVAAWGGERIWLSPLPPTSVGSRGGFTIHGGLTPGSAGCIDLTTHSATFMQKFRKYGRDMKLTVEYGD